MSYGDKVIVHFVVPPTNLFAIVKGSVQREELHPECPVEACMNCDYIQIYSNDEPRGKAATSQD